MTYACPAWEFAAECHLLKLQRLQNKVLRTIGNFPRRTSVHNMHKAFHIPYVYDYITNQNLIQEEIKRRLNSGNAYYYSIQKQFSSCLLTKNIKIRI
jgi:hypothetical protein